MDVRGGARHAAQRLEVAANQHVVVGKVFFQLHVYLHFRKLLGVAGVFAADGTDSRHRLFQPDVGTEADALQPEFQVLVRGAAGHFLCGFQGGGEVAQPFDVHLVAVALLAQLLPEVESFQAEIQQMQKVVTQSLSMQRCNAEENEVLKDELTAERRKSAEQRAKLTVLEERYKRAEKLLSKLPREMIEKTGDKKERQER